jgi:hypothetical protein
MLTTNGSSYVRDLMPHPVDPQVLLSWYMNVPNWVCCHKMTTITYQRFTSWLHTLVALFTAQYTSHSTIRTGVVMLYTYINGLGFNAFLGIDRLWCTAYLLVIQKICTFRKQTRVRNKHEAHSLALLAACFMLSLLIGLFNPEDGGEMFLENIIWLSKDYMALYPTRQNSS